MVNNTFPPPLVCRHIVSVFGLGDRKPERRAHSYDHRHQPLRSFWISRYDARIAAYSIPHNLCISSSSFPPRPSTLTARGVPFFSLFSFFRWSCTMLCMKAASAEKGFSATRSTTVKGTLNSNGASTHPCRRPCPTSSLSEHSHHPTARMLACRRGIGGRRRPFSVTRQNEQGYSTEGFGGWVHKLW